MQNIHSAINVSCRLWWGYNSTFKHATVHSRHLQGTTTRGSTRNDSFIVGKFSLSSSGHGEHLYGMLGLYRFNNTAFFHTQPYSYHRVWLSSETSSGDWASPGPGAGTGSPVRAARGSP